MNKKNLLEALKDQLEKDLLIVKEAVRATREAATHEESKPENEYDTRALEASYLAGAQAKRVAEIEELISMCKFVQLKDFGDDDGVASTAVVQVESHGKKSWLFFLPKGGGTFVPFESKNIQVITPASPLGEALVGLQAGDIATVESGHQSKDYKIISVC